LAAFSAVRSLKGRQLLTWGHFLINDGWEKFYEHSAGLVTKNYSYKRKMLKTKQKSVWAVKKNFGFRVVKHKREWGRVIWMEAKRRKGSTGGKGQKKDRVRRGGGAGVRSKDGQKKGGGLQKEGERSRKGAEAWGYGGKLKGGGG
jgi:hypothetical protein